nr:hypothetical protein KUHPSE09_09090 [Staphylococcus epidermidis]
MNTSSSVKAIVMITIKLNMESTFFFLSKRLGIGCFFVAGKDITNKKLIMAKNKIYLY